MNRSTPCGDVVKQRRQRLELKANATKHTCTFGRLGRPDEVRVESSAAERPLEMLYDEEGLQLIVARIWN